MVMEYWDREADKGHHQWNDKEFREEELRVRNSQRKRKGWHEYFLDLADMVSTRSTCGRAHHGAILVDKNNRIISTGYNGSDPGDPHCEDVGCLIEDNHCIRTEGNHAEDNCLRDQWVSKTDTLYITANPCSICLKMIKDFGVKKIVYRNKYFNGEFKSLGYNEVVEF